MCQAEQKGGTEGCSSQPNKIIQLLSLSLYPYAICCHILLLPWLLENKRRKKGKKNRRRRRRRRRDRQSKFDQFLFFTNIMR
jgi:hypothetical protein